MTKKTSRNRLRQEFCHSLMFQNPGYAHGDTLLHKKIRTFKDYAEIEDLIKDIGIKAATAMAMTNNNHGAIPINVLVDRFNSKDPKLSKETATKTYDKLIELVKSYRLNKLSYPISLAVTLKHIPDTNRALINNLKLGCYLANLARETIILSSTHTQINGKEQTLVTALDDKIERIRKERVNASFFKDNTERVASLAKKYRVGNCYEFSNFVLDALRNVDPGLSAELVCIENGDHVFVVIDRARGSDITNPATWGDSAIVCDAWAGEVYPAIEIPWRLKDFVRATLDDNTGFNILSSYNPRHHHLHLQLSQPAQTSTPYHTAECKLII